MPPNILQSSLKMHDYAKLNLVTAFEDKQFFQQLRECELIFGFTIFYISVRLSGH